MADSNGTPVPHRLKHVRIEGFRSEMTFSPPMRDMSRLSLGRNRDIHGPKLERELAKAFARAHEMLNAHDPQVQVGWLASISK
jgi:hypothetical protein